MTFVVKSIFNRVTLSDEISINPHHNWDYTNLRDIIIHVCKVLLADTVHSLYIVPLGIKGCICHFVKWQIHPFISIYRVRINPLKPEFAITIFILYKPRIDIAILDF